MVAPPKFAPHMQPIITLYDVVYDLAVQATLLTAPAASFRDHIYPILKRAQDELRVASLEIQASRARLDAAAQLIEEAIKGRTQ